MDHPRNQRAQSLVEFAISSAVLIVLFGGLVDVARAVQFADVLHNAAREGARYGATFSDGTNSNPHLNDTDIKRVVDAELNAGGLAASVQQNFLASTAPNSANCSVSVTDGNLDHNPPYASTSFPTTTNKTFLYLCQDTRVTKCPAMEATCPADLNVVLLMLYGPLTAFLPTGVIPGGFPIAANWHLNVQR